MEEEVENEDEGWGVNKEGRKYREEGKLRKGGRREGIKQRWSEE